MEVRELFYKYQKIILAFANTEVGKSYLGIKAGSPIVRLTPDGWHEKEDDIFKATFYPRSPLLKRLAIPLQAMEIANEIFDFRKLTKGLDLVIPHYLGLTRPRNYLPQVLFDTATFNPDANPETTSVDGRVWVGGQNAVWGTVRGTAGNNSSDSEASQSFVYSDSTTTSNQFATIIRGVFLFDTSSLDDNANISSATFSLYGTSKSNSLSFSDAHASIALVSSAPASNTALANADFNIANFGSTRFATDFSYTSFSTTGYNDMTLNASGVANISKTGVSKFGTMFACDLDNSAPNWVSGVATNINCNYADNGSNKPKLVVTYTLSGAFLAFLLKTRIIGGLIISFLLSLGLPHG